MQNETLPETTTPASQPTVMTKSPDGIPQMIGIAGIALAISFFLPWLNILGMRPSGFDLQRSNSGAIVFWTLPFFAVVAAIAGFTKSGTRTAAQISGLIPFAFLIYGLYDSGVDLLKLLDLGGFMAILAGVVLLVCSARIKA